MDNKRFLEKHPLLSFYGQNGWPTLTRRPLTNWQYSDKREWSKTNHKRASEQLEGALLQDFKEKIIQMLTYFPSYFYPPIPALIPW